MEQRAAASIVTFIVPCYNESARLALTWDGFNDYFSDPEAIPANVILVDDGSSDDTAAQLNQLCQKLSQSFPTHQFKHISYKPNRGKGWALKQGVDATTTSWLITLDADMATEPLQLMDWLDKKLVSFDTQQVYIGSRELGQKAGTVKSSFLRRNIGLVFNYFVRKISGLNIIDTQCGFKLYPTTVAQQAFSNLLDYGFVHDVEVLLNVKKQGVAITSLPLQWKEVAVSKVNVVTDSIKMFSSLIRIRLSK